MEVEVKSSISNVKNINLIDPEQTHVSIKLAVIPDQDYEHIQTLPNKEQCQAYIKAAAPMLYLQIPTDGSWSDELPHKDA